MRSPAMAGTGAASADNYEAVYANPAGLAFASHRRLTLGYVMAQYGATLDGQKRYVEDTSALLLGADLPLPLGGALAGRIAIGLGFYLPVGVINRARAPFPDVASLPLIDSNTQTVSVMVSGSVKFTERLSFGAGVIALAALVGTIRLGTDGGGRIITRSEQQLVTDYAPIAGLRWDPLDKLKLGLVLRGRSQSRYDIRVESKLYPSVIPFELPVFGISGVSQYDPWQVALEAGFAPRQSWLLVAQLTYKKWGDFPNPIDKATRGGTPLDPPGFHDTVVPRAAVEWRRRGEVLDLALRGGYFFEWSPSPSTSATLIDADKHVFSVGGELYLRNRYAPLHLEGFFQWHQLAPGGRVTGQYGAGGITLGAEL